MPISYPGYRMFETIVTVHHFQADECSSRFCADKTNLVYKLYFSARNRTTFAICKVF